MRIAKGLFWLLLVLAGIFVGGGLLLPDSVHIERETVIQRPPAQVFAVLNGFARFNEWSPWLEYDPATKTRIGGPATGIGAEMHWTSDKVGNGSQQIVEVETDRLIVIALEFDGHSGPIARYTLTPAGTDGTRIVWSFDDEFGRSLIARWFGLMYEKMIGKDYEKGLAKLKTVVESTPAPQPEAPVDTAVPADAGTPTDAATGEAAPATGEAAPAGDAAAPASDAAPTDAAPAGEPAPAEPTEDEAAPPQS